MNYCTAVAFALVVVGGCAPEPSLPMFIAPDATGQMLAVSSSSDKLSVVDLGTGRVAHSIRAPGSVFTTLAWLPSQKVLLATEQQGEKIRIVRFNEKLERLGFFTQGGAEILVQVDSTGVIHLRRGTSYGWKNPLKVGLVNSRSVRVSPSGQETRSPVDYDYTAPEVTLPPSSYSVQDPDSDYSYAIVEKPSGKVVPIPGGYYSCLATATLAKQLFALADPSRANRPSLWRYDPATGRATEVLTQRSMELLR